MFYRHSHIKPKIKKLRPKKHFFKSRWFWFILGMTLLLGAAGYTVFLSKKFDISHVIISGNEKIASEDIENIIRTETSNRMFLISRKRAERAVLTIFPSVEQVYLRKKFPNTISLQIKERSPSALFCQDRSAGGEQCFFIDKNGVIFEPLTSIPKGMILIRRESGHEEILEGERAVAEYLVQAVSKIQDSLKNNLQIDAREALVSNPLMIQTSENWRVYFDPEGDIALQIIKMEALLRDEISANARKQMQYLYLQYKDRAYYK